MLTGTNASLGKRHFFLLTLPEGRRERHTRLAPRERWRRRRVSVFQPPRIAVRASRPARRGSRGRRDCLRPRPDVGRQDREPPPPPMGPPTRRPLTARSRWGARTSSSAPGARWPSTWTSRRRWRARARSSRPAAFPRSPRAPARRAGGARARNSRCGPSPARAALAGRRTRSRSGCSREARTIWWRSRGASCTTRGSTRRRGTWRTWRTPRACGRTTRKRAMGTSGTRSSRRWLPRSGAPRTWTRTPPYRWRWCGTVAPQSWARRCPRR